MPVQQPSPDEPTAHRALEGTPDRALQLTPGTILGERYRIVSLIGRGGMGEVYRADDLKLGQSVALKFLTHHGDAHRLYEEVRVGRQISHPNVCRLHDVAEVDGHLFITMEFVDGEDLASLLRRVGRLPSEKALAVSRDICAGLAAAHEKGVIHRDLKPANVMIDGRGRARVTDFGLALTGTGAADGAGTPAYMAPEQLEGRPASMKSDMYSLGLVLYEIYTGRRAYESTSTRELIERQRRGDFTRPSEVTRDVSADVERMITRCLDPDPARRPASVEDIARELPGGDPLAAAIAAGETPSPAMVAAASDRGELSVRTAWAVLIAYVAMLVMYSLLGARTMVYRLVPMKSPEILIERVEEVLAATTHTLPRADWSASYATDAERLRRVAGNRDLISDGSPLLFRYRQSPRPLVAQNSEHLVELHNPPLITSGMANVILDSTGALVQFMIVPPQMEEPPPSRRPVDWNPFLRLARLKGEMRPVAPRWASLVDSDEKSAWMVGSDGTRVEAAAYHGRPVSFAVVPPWRTPARMNVAPADIGKQLSTAAAVTINFAFWAAAIALAIRNLRRGQGDMRSARRLALFMFVVSFAGLLLLAHHVADMWAETELIILTAALAIFIAVETWVGYIAIEPLVRRRWPRMLISATRLLGGRLRDPMIGRDVLIGMSAGAIVLLLRELTALLPGAAPFQSVNLTLSGIRYVGWFAAIGFCLAIIGPIIGATLLVGVHIVTRSLPVTMLLVGPLGGAVMIGDASGPLWARVLFGAIAAATVLFLLFRFGILAYGGALFSYAFSRRVPVTLDPNAWYFGRSAFAFALLMLIVLFAFFTSLGGKRWLPEVAVDA